MSLFWIFLLLLLPSFPISTVSQGNATVSQGNATVSCPLDFAILRQLAPNSSRSSIGDVNAECQYIRQSLRLVQANYLQKTGSFVPPLNSAESCWSEFQTLVDDYGPKFDIRSSCGFQTSWIAQGCVNITTRAQFEAVVPETVIDDIVENCNQSLSNSSPCASCTTSFSNSASYLTGASVGNLSACSDYPSIYAAAFANYLGPNDRGTLKCLFSLDFTSARSGKKKKKKIVVILAVLICSGFGLLLIIGGIWWLWHRHEQYRLRKRRNELAENRERGLGSALESISGSANVLKFDFDEIKEATRNFARDNIIGRGGYGNVYKGVLPDGSEVALKRFKNCSAAGDTNFAHEVQVIASIRHVNLVALRGYCIATTRYEGHQRIIVCDLMKNGSVYDHLFGSQHSKLSWPIRQQIAVGTARGLAYLHYGAQPAIIHRDIKANNILLDEKFDAKVADFGLARFTEEGATHVSTRVAGTMGYVAPEYALYGQLTERSDVYSFGVVLLEILSGRKALLMNNDNQHTLVTDWAWSLVREGRALDVIEDNMPESGDPEVLEKYVLIALLCSHPQLYARPTMDQVVTMLETDLSVPTIPERPIPLVADIDDIERSISSSGSGQLSGSSGFHQYTS